MSTAVIITICCLLLIAYVFDITASRTKIPSVILFLLLGWLVNYFVVFFELRIPLLSPLLPVLGTIGLILIVLEGALELQLNRNKIRVVNDSFFIALLSILFLAGIYMLLFHFIGGYSLRSSLINSIPFCVISSAIAIPSVKNINVQIKEFVTYESSFSDILGVLFFNFMVMNEFINLYSFGTFGLQLLVMIGVSLLGTIVLSLLLNRINHHIKFAPIILLVILIYMLSKVYHLPGLIFILVFGLFIGNLSELRHSKWIRLMKTEKLDKEVQKFKELTTEAAFIVRALFFILFGFVIEPAEVFEASTMPWALVITASIFAVRIALLKAFKLPFNTLVYVAPRGLISILLFLSIPFNESIPIVNNALIVQVVLLSILVMMAGLLLQKKNLHLKTLGQAQ